MFLLTAIGTQCLAQDINGEKMATASKLMLQQNYNEAIKVYNDVLAADPANIQANYNMAISLNGAHRQKDAVPYLQKILTLSAGNFMLANTYNFLGGIYDDSNEPEKAITAYETGIKLQPDYRPLYSNLATVNFRVKRYDEAEHNAIKALKLEPKNGSSMRIYALVTFHQNKRAPALLGLCYFLMLEPKGQKSSEALGNVQNIFAGGTLKTEPGQKAAPINLTQNAVIQSSLKSIANKRYAAASDLLAAQLTAIVRNLSALQNDKTETYNALINYFVKLSQSGNMQTFARVINQGGNPANAEWLSANPDKVAAYNQWIATSQLTF
ncbi:tetratricopeptide repeat protein [Mucilaginibacter sp.]|uniref:tetratricopeptide repeat protein n=1 Tax=Mucilaginibacter sp. TaxID=1882438 RepID=UPI0035BC0B50